MNKYTICFSSISEKEANLIELTKQNTLLLNGYCESPPFPHTKERACRTINPLYYFLEMHTFEYNLDNIGNFPGNEIEIEDNKDLELSATVGSERVEYT